MTGETFLCKWYAIKIEIKKTIQNTTQPLHRCHFCIVTVGKHRHTVITVWMTCAVGGFNRACRFDVQTKKTHNRYMSSQMPRWLTSAFFGNFFFFFFHSDITGCKFFALACSASSCMWGADERWWRGVCSTASRSINGAQPTHSCADEGSPRLIIQHCPPRFGRTQPGGDGEVKKRERDGVWDAINFRMSFICVHLFGEHFVFFSGWMYKPMNKHDGACDCGNTWLRLVKM